MGVRAQILRDVDAYLAATGMSESRFGIRVCKNHRLVPNIRLDLRAATLTTVEKIEAFLAAQQSAAQEGVHTQH